MLSEGPLGSEVTPLRSLLGALWPHFDFNFESFLKKNDFHGFGMFWDRWWSIWGVFFVLPLRCRGIPFGFAAGPGARGENGISVQRG